MNNHDNFIIFKVNELLCALNCIEVQEIIRGKKNITSIKKTPDYIAGVINLRGEIVSIINLATFFKFPSEKIDSQAIIVVKLDDECFGFMVTEVLDIISQESALIESPPVTPKSMNKEYLNGVFNLDGKLISQVNVSAILSLESTTI